MIYFAAGFALLAAFALTRLAPGMGQMTALVTAFASLLYLTVRALLAKRQTDDLHKMQTAYEQLDQQAKLIIRTDLELHQAQEELDRRLACLMALHQLSRQLDVSLRPEEVFAKLDASIVNGFGCTLGLVGTSSSFEAAVEWRSVVGVDEKTAQRLKTQLANSPMLKEILTGQAPVILHTSDALKPEQRKLVDLLGVPSVAIAGILPHSGPAGYIILGRTGSSAVTAKVNAELVGLLANQLATAIENSALYEKSWLAQQSLERKVQERTKELAEANEALQQMNKAKSDFVSAVSHELRTPMAAIKGYASLIGTGQFGSLTDAQRERIAKIEKHTDLLTQLINNLLDIARIESGRVTMERRSIPADDFLNTIQETVHPQIEAKHIQFAVDRDGVTEFFGDPQHLQRVFINLLSNAVKYTPEGGTIRIGLRKADNIIHATISDTGSGIPKDDLPKLFQEFYRANDPVNQQVRGTGLGLALVKRIVLAHQGNIAVASEKGKGTTFTIQLPANPTPEAAANG